MNTHLAALLGYRRATPGQRARIRAWYGSALGRALSDNPATRSLNALGEGVERRIEQRRAAKEAEQAAAAEAARQAQAEHDRLQAWLCSPEGVEWQERDAARQRLDAARARGRQELSALVVALREVAADPFSTFREVDRSREGLALARECLGELDREPLDQRRIEAAYAAVQEWHAQETEEDRHDRRRRFARLDAEQAREQAEHDRAQQRLRQERRREDEIRRLEGELRRHHWMLNSYGSTPLSRGIAQAEIDVLRAKLSRV